MTTTKFDDIFSRIYLEKYAEDRQRSFVDFVIATNSFYIV